MPEATARPETVIRWTRRKSGNWECTIGAAIHVATVRRLEDGWELSTHFPGWGDNWVQTAVDGKRNAEDRLRVFVKHATPAR